MYYNMLTMTVDCKTLKITMGISQKQISNLYVLSIKISIKTCTDNQNGEVTANSGLVPDWLSVPATEGSSS